jgi:hypothetical protein
MEAIMKSVVVILVLALIVAAYFVGYWPEHKRLGESQKDAQIVAAQLADAQERLRIYGLQNQLLSLIQKVAETNYGEAQKLSSDFFDQVRTELAQTKEAELKSSLGPVLVMRDSVTAGLAKGDPATLEILQKAMRIVHGLLGRAY